MGININAGAILNYLNSQWNSKLGSPQELFIVRDKLSTNLLSRRSEHSITSNNSRNMVSPVALVHQRVKESGSLVIVFKESTL
jgi:hypothetical protein